MKKLFKSVLIGITAAFILSCPVYAQLGDSGFFGGISEGRRLDKTTQLKINETKNKKQEEYKAPYKELIFLTGRPIEYSGLITTNSKEKIDIYDKSAKQADEFKLDYKVENSATTPQDVSINRTLKYKVKYRIEGKQVIKDYETDDWSESINSGGVSFTLDEDQSYSTVSVIEDYTPGVTYYKGNLSHRAVYTGQDGNTTLEMSGTFYGYTCAYSTTETYRIDCTVSNDNWQMQYQLRPSVSVAKTLQYTENEPTSISFEGNYQDVMQNKSGLSYNIYVKPPISYDIADTGTISIDSFNDFEQLLAIDTGYVKGHFAEYDIKRLYAMQILTEDTKFYQPDQAITRGQFVEMLVKAIKLPVENTQATGKSKKSVVNLVFPDVLPERDDYRYIMAAYKSGLAVGRSNGHFYIDSPIERQEAIVILLRTLGLETLGLEPTSLTAFTDNSEIASWAKKEVYAANKLGIVAGDEDGNFRTTDFVSKAEAAALVNRLNQYMRSDLQTDYTENIVNYAD
ncbi:MAG: S-layer homology domain-containing protein [Firmicutes bacterium]|nr:S-layer homology domain-containing protein [Bacillota bacterium]